MKDLLIRRPLWFFIVFLPCAIAGGIVLYLISKRELFLYINGYHHPFFDIFFAWETWLGNGTFFIIICLLLLFRNYGNALLGMISFTFSAIFPQALKKLVFADIVRPVKYFEGDVPLHLVEGMRHHHYFSFPSGHSTSIFATMFFLTLIIKNPKWGALFAGIALVTAFSRVYLAQHFFSDIYAGAWLGIFSTMLAFVLFEKLIKNKTGLRKGLLKNKS